MWQQTEIRSVMNGLCIISQFYSVKLSQLNGIPKFFIFAGCKSGPLSLAQLNYNFECVSCVFNRVESLFRTSKLDRKLMRRNGDQSLFLRNYFLTFPETFLEIIEKIHENFQEILEISRNNFSKIGPDGDRLLYARDKCHF